MRLLKSHRIAPECQAGTGWSPIVNWSRDLNPCGRVALLSTMARQGMKHRRFCCPRLRQECLSPLLVSPGLSLSLLIVLPFCSVSPHPHCSPSFPLFLPSSFFPPPPITPFVSHPVPWRPPFSPCSEMPFATEAINSPSPLKDTAVRVVFSPWTGFFFQNYL